MYEGWQEVRARLEAPYWFGFPDPGASVAGIILGLTLLFLWGHIVAKRGDL